MTTWLARSAFAAMRAEAAEIFPLESGGLLLGWRSGNDRVVVSILGPGPMAMHGRTRFVPDHKWQMHHLNQIFADSSGDIDYLGDWHSHPGGRAHMSSLDHQTLRRISRHVPQPLMAIVAADAPSPQWELGCWRDWNTRWRNSGRNIRIEPVIMFDAQSANEHSRV